MRRRSLGQRVRLLGGQRDDNPRAAARWAIGAHLPPVLFDQPLRRRETQPRAAVLCREKRFEHALAGLRGHPRAGVVNGQIAPAVVALDRHRHGTMAAHRLRRVQQEIREHDMQQLGICFDRLLAPMNDHVHLRQVRVLLEQHRRGFDQGPDWHVCHARSARACEEQQILHHLVE